MSDMKKLLESIDAIQESSDDVTITFTRPEALSLGLLTCKCGHPENNHFNHTDSCAHCDCKRYRERARVGKLTAPSKFYSTKHTTPTPRDVMDVGNQPGEVKGDWDMQRFGDMIRNKK